MLPVDGDGLLVHLERDGASDGIFLPVLGLTFCIVLYLHLHLHGLRICDKVFHFNHGQRTENEKTGLCMRWTGFGLVIGVSELQIHGIRRRFYNDYNVNGIRRYGQGYYGSRWIGRGDEQNNFYGGDLYSITFTVV